MRPVFKSLLCASALTLSTTACAIRDLVDVDTPPAQGQLVDYATVATYGGALSLYYGAIGTAGHTIRSYTRVTAITTDELQAATSVTVGDIDARIENQSQLTGLFLQLSKLRLNAQWARGALQRFPAEASPANIGELFALEGMANVLLAEGFCSGVPLTRIAYGENFQYTPGYNTEEVYTQAIALFDSALVYGSDSLAVRTLALVGKGRALLGLGRYADAAAAVNGVATNDLYRFLYSGSPGGDVFWGFSTPSGSNNLVTATQVRIVNAEGGSGLIWLSASQDPRIPVVVTSGVSRQGKYLTPGGTDTQIAADGIEARLIEAEAQLQPANAPSGPWLATLNSLRARAGLVDTTDPGNATARVNLLFRERAFWTWLTGHRHGDARRLVRQYARSVSTVYPSGAYTAFPSTARPLYNDLVTLVPTAEEQRRNTLYSGCFNREP